MLKFDNAEHMLKSRVVHFRQNLFWLCCVSVALVLSYIFFGHLEPNEFIYSGDQFFRFSEHEAISNSFFLRKSLDLGVLNGWQFATQFWDSLFYLLIFKVTSDLKIVEEILFFLALLSTVAISFLGFRKIGSEIMSENDDWLTFFILAVWYSFNPYTLELWHGGVFNLGSGLTYSLAPLVFYYFKRALFSDTELKQIIICALLLAISSFTFWLLAPLMFFLLLYWIARFVQRNSIRWTVLKNTGLLLFCYVPLVAFVLAGIMHEFFNRGGDNNESFDPSFGNIQGGLGYQLLMLFSWAIYTEWTPRTMYSFADYFFSPGYISGIIAMYGVVVVGTWRVLCDKGSRFFRIKVSIFRKHLPAIKKPEIVVLVGIFFSALFLAKGSQPPLGEVFVYLYNHIPFFSVFRTPDIRFGFVMVLCVGILLAWLSTWYRSLVLRTLVLVFTLLQAWPFFSGLAVRGENVSGKYFDRVVHIPTDYSDLADFINMNANPLAYVLPLPATEYGHYRFSPGEDLIGQDMLSKFITMPFLYTSATGGISSKTYTLLKETLAREDFEGLKKFPIKYVVFRKDVDCSDCVYPESKMMGQGRLVFENPTFRLYELNSFLDVLGGSASMVRKINPVKYEVSFARVKSDQNIRLLQNFSENWKIFPLWAGRVPTGFGDNMKSEIKIFDWNDFEYLFRPALAGGSHELQDGYANSWTVSVADLKGLSQNGHARENADGSFDFSVVLIYYPQIYYIFAAFVSLVTFLVLALLALFLRPRGSNAVG